jgi:hypothetical protein
MIEGALPEQLLEEAKIEETEALGENPSSYEEAQSDLGEIQLERGPESGDEVDPLEEEAKAAWEEQDDNAVEAGVVVGLSPLGPIVQVVSPNGDRAQKVVSVEELFLLSGQMTAIASMIMQMGMQQQMAEQARLQQMMEQGEERTKSGLYVKR